jgi:uncharacterized protein
MKSILVVGCRGLVGRAVVDALWKRGDRVTVLSRDPARAKKTVPREVRVARWTPLEQESWADELDAVDAVIDFAAANPFSQTWTSSFKVGMHESRVNLTQNLIAAMAAARRRPKVFIQGSHTGFYGINRDSALDESSEAGNDDFAQICDAAEQTASEVAEIGARCVHLRLGQVICPSGGALEDYVGRSKPVLLRSSSPEDNHVPWVHIDDVVGMTLWALDEDAVSGAVNVTGPAEATRSELHSTVKDILGKASIQMPRALEHYLFKEKAVALAGNLQVVPKVAIEKGYEFHFTDARSAIIAALTQAS